MKALASQLVECVSGSIPGPGVICGLSFMLLPYSIRSRNARAFLNDLELPKNSKGYIFKNVWRQTFETFGFQNADLKMLITTVCVVFYIFLFTHLYTHLAFMLCELLLESKSLSNVIQEFSLA